MSCKGIFDHSIGKLITVEITKNYIIKKCIKCGYLEKFIRASKSVYFPSNLLQQKKKWAADDNRKELLQPLTEKGTVNEDFTEAYGFNPYDERTKAYTPQVQKGIGA